MDAGPEVHGSVPGKGPAQSDRRFPTESINEAFVDGELRFGLGLAVDAEVLADVNATSGVQTQAFATSVLTTLRKALTKREAAGY